MQHRAHQLAVVGGLEHLDELEQGELDQGQRVSPFYESLGRFSLSLTRWPPHVRDRHSPVVQKPELHHPRGLTPVACLTF